MAFSAHTDPKFMKEHKHDPELEAKLDTLAEWVDEAEHLVCTSGAGISCSAGIPDFRGENGVWTLKAQGRKRKKPTTRPIKAFPTLAHMALVKLQDLGVLGHMISTNCDGIHVRSGMRRSNISELHGNSTIEYCIECGHEFIRDFPCYRITRSRDHFTGRYCHCGGRLWDSTIDFGQNLPEEPLRRAYAESRAADLHIVFGSSLTVTPAADMPAITKEEGQGNRRLVIVNFQLTPLSEDADMHLHAPIDTVVEGLMARLQTRHPDVDYSIPQWRLRRRMQVHESWDPHTRAYSMRVAAIDPDAPDTDHAAPATVFSAVTLAVPTLRGAHNDSEPFIFEATLPESTLARTADADGTVTLTLSWFGHYAEPDLALPHRWLPFDAPTDAPAQRTRTLDLLFAPEQLTWEIVADDLPTLHTPAAPAPTTPAPQVALETIPLDTLAPHMRTAALDATPRAWAAGAACVTTGPVARKVVLALGGAARRTTRVPGLPDVALVSLDGADDAPARCAHPPRVSIDVHNDATPDDAAAALQELLGRWCMAAAVADADPTTVYVFGGWDGGSQYNDVHAVRVGDDLALHVAPVATNEGPSFRGAATLTPIGGTRLLLLGGAACTGGPYAYAGDAWVLDTAEATWSRAPISGPTPPRRAQHVAVRHAGHVLVAGGLSQDTLLADVWSLDLETWRWTCLYDGEGTDAGTAPRSIDVAARTKPFRVLRAAPAAAATDTHLFLVGMPEQEAPVFAMHLPSGTWQRPDLDHAGDNELPAGCHAAAVVSPDTMLLVGGTALGPHGDLVGRAPYLWRLTLAPQ